MNMVFFYIAVLGLLQGANSEWNGAVKRLLEIAPISSADVKTITADVFNRVNYTALYQSCEMKPRAGILNSPLGCDIIAYAYMKQGLDQPDKFKGNSFLCDVWSSDYGEALIKYFQGRGVDKSLLNDAFRQTWFIGDKAKLKGSPFDGVFFARRTSGRGSFNNWYTLFMISNDPRYSSPTMVYHGNVLPQCVEGRSQNYLSKFLYPSHPYVDLIAFTLCYWRSEYKKKCEVEVPRERTFAVEVNRQSSGDEYHHVLYNAHFNCQSQ